VEKKPVDQKTVPVPKENSTNFKKKGKKGEGGGPPHMAWEKKKGRGEIPLSLNKKRRTAERQIEGDRPSVGKNQKKKGGFPLDKERREKKITFFLWKK